MANQPINPYELMRKRAQQANVADEQAAQDAIARKFAAMGASNSGAAIKQQQIMADKAAQQRQAATESVDIEEAKYNAAREEAQKQRDFQQGQFEKQFGLAKEQFGLAKEQFGLDKQTKMKQLEMAQRAQDEEERINRYNQFNAAIASGNPDVLFEAMGLDFWGTQSGPAAKDALAQRQEFLRTGRINPTTKQRMGL